MIPAASRTRPPPIVTASTETPRQRRTPKPKPSRPDPRTVLLRTLREQRRRIDGMSYLERIDAPELFDLAMAADAAPRGKRSAAGAARGRGGTDQAV